jgi:hypothetical protein
MTTQRERITVLDKIFLEFNRRKVRYLVAGGVAVTLYGNPRFTKDLDLFLDPREENVRRAVQAFKALGFVPRAPVKAEEFISAENREKWKREKGMLAFTFINPKNPFENVDLLFSAPMPFETAYRRKKIFRSKDIPIPTIGVKDLIRMKQTAGRPHDLADLAILDQVDQTQKEKR